MQSIAGYDHIKGYSFEWKVYTFIAYKMQIPPM